MKHINIPVTEDEYKALQEAKDGRTWREALREEFGIDD